MYSRNLDRKRRVGFIVQRCGNEVIGGAESLCLQVAQRLAKHWDTEVLTTCALDYMEWRNYYPQGVECSRGTKIRRFPVDEPRNVKAFNCLSSDLHQRQGNSTLEEQEKWMHAQGPISTLLFRYLREHRDTYDAFIFFGYLYATTYFGLPLVQDKAYLAPLAHDEWTIHLTMWDELFKLPRGFVFQTESERSFVKHRFSNLSLHGPVAGVGVDALTDLRPQRFREKYCLTNNFLLFVGRIDESKGCSEMFDFFMKWQRVAEAVYDLVLLGTEVMPVPYHERIVYLGAVSEEEKWDAQAACDWLLLPSKYESLSIVLLETWATGRPAIVNGASDVLRAHCCRSAAGLWYENWDQCRAIIETVSPEEQSTLGRNGRKYVSDLYSWERVEEVYLTLVSRSTNHEYLPQPA